MSCGKEENGLGCISSPPRPFGFLPFLSSFDPFFYVSSRPTFLLFHFFPPRQRHYNKQPLLPSSILRRTPFAMAPVAESLNEVKEVTLRVVLPLLGDNSSKKINSSPCAYNSFWTLTLTRSGTLLTIDILWNRGSHHDYTFYNSMLVFARGEYNRGEKVSSTGIMFMNGGTQKGRTEAMCRVVISHRYVL